LFERLEPRELLSISHLSDGPLANDVHLPGPRFALVHSERGANANEFGWSSAHYAAGRDGVTAPIQLVPDRAFHDHRGQRQLPRQRLETNDARAFSNDFARDANPLARTVVSELRVQVVPLQVVSLDVIPLQVGLLQIGRSFLPVAGELFGRPPLTASFAIKLAARDARPETTLLVLHGRGDGWEGTPYGESWRATTRGFELADQAQSPWQSSSVAGMVPVERPSGVRAPETARSLGLVGSSLNQGPVRQGGAGAADVREGGLIPLERRESTPRPNAISGQSILRWPLDSELGGGAGEGTPTDRQTVPLPLKRGATDEAATADRQSQSQSQETNGDEQNSQDEAPEMSRGGNAARHAAREGGLVDLLPERAARNRLCGSERVNVSQPSDLEAGIEIVGAATLSVDANSGLFRALEIAGPSREGWLSPGAGELAQRLHAWNAIGCAALTDAMFTEPRGRSESSRGADNFRYAPWVLPLVVFAAGASAVRRQRSKATRPGRRRPIEPYWCDRFFASLVEAEAAERVTTDS
jgi:hypothetical protein